MESENGRDGDVGGGAPSDEATDAPRGLDGRLARLEAIVAALDSDSLDLDEALALFEEGVAHARLAQEMLSKAELRVEELIGPEGEEVREFEPRPDGDDV